MTQPYRALSATMGLTTESFKAGTRRRVSTRTTIGPRVIASRVTMQDHLELFWTRRCMIQLCRALSATMGLTTESFRAGKRRRVSTRTKLGDRTTIGPRVMAARVTMQDHLELFWTRRCMIQLCRALSAMMGLTTESFRA